MALPPRLVHESFALGPAASFHLHPRPLQSAPPLIELLPAYWAALRPIPSSGVPLRMLATKLLSRHMVATSTRSALATKPSSTLTSAAPSHKASFLQRTPAPCQSHTSHPTARPRLCASAALPAAAAVVLPEPEPNGPAMPPFLDDLFRITEGLRAPPLPATCDAVSVLGVEIPLVAFASNWAADDLRHCGWTWLTLPSPSHPYRSKVDEEGIYIEPRFSHRMKAHLENRPLYGHY